jgi:hypothetical protein
MYARLVGKRGSMTANILQIAYYPALLEIRAKVLEAAGYEVTSTDRDDVGLHLDDHLVCNVPLQALQR